MSLKTIYPTFKRALGEAEGEINSNEGRFASWADEVYCYPPPSAAAADHCGDTDEDKITAHINKNSGDPLVGASGSLVPASYVESEGLSWTEINMFMFTYTQEC